MKRFLSFGVLCLAGVLPALTAHGQIEKCGAILPTQEEAIIAIQKRGGQVEFDAKQPGNPVVKVALAWQEDITPELKLLQSFPNLRVLDLSFSGVKPKNLVHLKNLKQLEELNLGFTNMDDAALAQLKPLANLKKLNLGMGCKWSGHITDQGVAHLKALPKLEWLNLDWNLLTDAGLRELQGIPSLRHVHIGWQDKITTKAVNDLKKALPNAVVIK